jgi:ribosomal protein L37AE/L43A
LPQAQVIDEKVTQFHAIGAAIGDTITRVADSELPDACDVVPDCPVCGAKLYVAHNHAKLKICVCKTCGTSLSIPDEAFDVARHRRPNRP